MAHLSVVASPLAILPLPPSRFRPLAPYCPISRHLTANPPPQLAPYCSPPAGTLLLLTGWHPTPHRRWLASPLPRGSARHLPFRSVGPSSVTPRRGIALPPWLCPKPWIDVMTCLTVHHGCGGPSTGVFLCRRSSILSIRPRKGLSAAVAFFCFGEPAERFGSFYLYVSMYCFHTGLGYIILGARQGGLFLWTRGV